VLAFLVRRVLFAALTLVLTAFFAYGLIRLLKPNLFHGEALGSGTLHDVSRALLHLDFGGSCMFAGCPSLHGMWVDGIWADLFLLAGGVAFGLGAGLLGGTWCAARRRAKAARALEASAMVFYCAPVYVVGFGVLLLFAPPFGLIQLPYFFDPHSYAARRSPPRCCGSR
jgi:ABC-type antimicrobial peptide transport system permease subunit